jgi:nascent polypeptide-associated complex subunit alpha
MAYKALKATRGAPGGRDAMRMMQKMGMKIDEVPGVSEVVIRTVTKDIVIAEPTVTMVNVQGQTMYQVAGGQVKEATPQPAAPAGPTDADAQLVALQTGRSIDDARRALTDSGGDLAKAILALKSQ